MKFADWKGHCGKHTWPRRLRVCRPTMRATPRQYQAPGGGGLRTDVAESWLHPGSSALLSLQGCSMDVVGERSVKQAVLGSSAHCTLRVQPGSRKIQVLLTGKRDSEEKLLLSSESYWHR